MHECVSTARLGGSRAMFPQEIFLKLKCSEIASEAILGQMLRRSCYMARRVLHPIFDCSYIMHLLSKLTLNFHKRR